MYYQLIIAYPFYKDETLTFFILEKINNPKIWLSVIAVSVISSISLLLRVIWLEYLGSVADNMVTFRKVIIRC